MNVTQEGAPSSMTANPTLAEVYHRAAARSGDTTAIAELGLFLFKDGRRAEAMPWVSQAAYQGDPRACYILGVALHNGDWVERDVELARNLLRVAAAAGIKQSAEALNELGSLNNARGEDAAYPAVRKGPKSAKSAPPRETFSSLDRLVEATVRPLLNERLQAMAPELFGRRWRR